MKLNFYNILLIKKNIEMKSNKGYEHKFWKKNVKDKGWKSTMKLQSHQTNEWAPLGRNNHLSWSHPHVSWLNILQNSISYYIFVYVKKIWAKFTKATPV